MLPTIASLERESGSASTDKEASGAISSVVGIKDGHGGNATSLTRKLDPSITAAFRCGRSLRLERLAAFKNQNHSLRINVSDLAACAGFHPYKSLPKLFYEHVYQGFAGQELLRHDAKLLDLQIVSDEQIWNELAVKAGAATQLALKKALEVHTGKTKVVSVDAAEDLRRQVVKEAKSSKRLNPQQLATLEEGARHSIHTGFGTAWETQALDMYEQQCGWEVSERNTEVRVWEFDANGKEIRPPHPAERPSKHLGKFTDDSGLSVAGDNKRQKISEDGTPCADNEMSATIRDGETDTDSVIGQNVSREAKVSHPIVIDDDSDSSVLPPFFSIRGSVDGIREEMAPIAKESRGNRKSKHVETAEDEFFDDDSWALRRVIVECKHRMRRLQPTPPLYEMIQATVYCLMYEAEEADLVQVLRKQKPGHQLPKKKEEKENESCNTITMYFPLEGAQGKKPGRTSVLDPEQVQHKTANAEPTTADDKPATSDVVKEDSNKTSIVIESSQVLAETSQSIAGAQRQAPTTNSGGKADETSTAIEIAVSRISVNDPVFQHRNNVEGIVLPRLHSWTQAVYSVRRDDSKRYQLLMALSSEDLCSAWALLLQECPWVRHCDTSHNREVSTCATQT